MARRRVAEEARRKKRTMYLTDAEYDSAIGYVSSLRGDGVDYRKPVITQTAQRPKVEATRTPERADTVAVRPKPVKAYDPDADEDWRK